MPRPVPRRLILLSIVAAIGFYSRRHPIGYYLWDKSMGDLCYAAGAFLLIGVIAPCLQPETIAGIALLYCLAIECFKLTGLPARWDGHAILRVIFGTQFSWHNIACYLAAIGVFLAMEKLAACNPRNR
jgi:uncharacterized protein DUF2809